MQGSEMTAVGTGFSDRHKARPYGVTPHMVFSDRHKARPYGVPTSETITDYL